MKILFLCIGNSIRSQMAEGLARELLGPGVEVMSAGAVATHVHPMAIEVMREIGIDLGAQRSKGVDSLSKGVLEELDFIITLCAEQVCPVVPSRVTRLSWPLPDPGGFSASHEEKLNRFRSVRDELKRRILKQFRSPLDS